MRHLSTSLVLMAALGSLAAAPQEGGAPDSSAAPGGPSTGLRHVGSLGGFPKSPSAFAMESWRGGMVHPDGDRSPNRDGEALAISNRVVSILASRLGTSWRVGGPDRSKVTHEWISIDGPTRDDLPERRRLLATALQAAHESASASVKAERAPNEHARRDELALAAEAAARVDAATAPLRTETIIIPLGDASGEDVAAALKAALPWATFASVGGRQIVATGVKAELELAKELAGRLEAEAAGEHERARREENERGAESPAGRILARPITIDFEGGALSAYLKALATAAGAESWVVDDARLNFASVPATKLTGVTVDTALRMLDGMTIGSLNTSVPQGGIFRVERVNASQGMAEQSPPIYRIGANWAGTAADPRREVVPPTITEVFDVALTQYRDIEGGAEKTTAAHENLLAAIEAGTSVLGSSNALKIKLHAPSGMLFVSGTPAEMALIRSIVQQWSSTQSS